MDFVTVLDQVIALLRQRGRLTYRTLQRQFQLDDEALEDLKLELITGQRLAVDDEGTVLVWTGDTATPVSPAVPRRVKKLMRPRTCSISGAPRAVHGTGSGLHALRLG